MENVFNLKRFGNLFSKQLREHLRTYLMSFVVFTSIILLFFIFLISTKGGQSLGLETQFMVCGVSLFFGVFIFAGNIFSDYNHPRSAFTTTMLPASLFEKYLLYWIISLIGFTVLALGANYIAQAIVIGYLKVQGIEASHYFIWKTKDILPPSERLILVYFFLHSIAFLGAITFRKRTIIMTALVSILTIGSYMYLTYKTSFLAYKGGNTPIPFISAYVNTPEGFALVNQSPNNELWIIISICTLVILFWICAFFKLKEREI